MKIAGHTEGTIREALEAANEIYDGNLTIRDIHRDGKTGRSKYLNVRITVKETRSESGEIMPGVHTTRIFGRGLRANSAASWNAHGEFMARLFAINPETVIRSGSIANGGVVLKTRGEMIAHWPDARRVFRGSNIRY